MWQVSDRFLTAIRGPHKMVCVVDILDGGNPVEGYTDLPVVGGQIIRDRTAAHFGRCSLQVAAPDLAPLDAQSPLSPAGFEISIQVGVEYPDGTRELIPVFVGGIQQSTVDASDKTTQIEALDRSKRVADSLLIADVTFSGDNPRDVPRQLVEAVLGDQTDANWEGATNYPLDDIHAIYAVGDDPWAICLDIAKSFGYETFFDGAGTWTIRDEPNVTTTSPVWAVDEGDDGVIVDVALTWDREPAANWVRVTGTNTEFDVTYTAGVYDNDPASPSYWGTNDNPSRFGHKPLPPVHSQHVQSTAAAVAAAKALLAAKQGLPMSLDFSTCPNYALTAGDVVQVSSDRLGLDLPVVLDGLTLDLVPGGAMTAQVRARQESTPEEV